MSKHRNFDLIPNGVKDMGSSFNLQPFPIKSEKNYSVQLVFSGSPVGTFKLQASNDADQPGNYTDIDGSSVSISASGNIMYNIAEAGYRFVRVVFTFTSGTGSLDSAQCSVKG